MLDEFNNRRFVLSKKLAMEDMTDNDVTIFHVTTFSRLKLSKGVYHLISKFKEPAFVRDIVPEHFQEQLKPHLLKLIEKKFLLDETDVTRFADQPLERRLAKNSHTLFNSPRYQEGHAVADVSVLGVPYDFGNRVAPGARKGPTELRMRSLDYDYRVDLLTGKPWGWFDVEDEERILDGVTISDWGDVWFRYGESPDQIFHRVGDIIADINAAGSFPMVIGGDHSISYPVVEQLQRQQPLTVVWFDAHTDFSDLAPGVCNNHANVVRRILGLPNVARVVEVGHRGFTLNNKLQTKNEKLTILTGARIRERGMDYLLDSIPSSQPCYVSVDIDVLDPIYAPATSTPVPGGLSPQELKQMLRVLGQNRDVVGFDLVEINPERDIGWSTTIVGCHLILTALGSFMARRKKKSELSEEELVSQAV